MILSLRHANHAETTVQPATLQTSVWSVTVTMRLVTMISALGVRKEIFMIRKGLCVFIVARTVLNVPTKTRVLSVENRQYLIRLVVVWHVLKGLFSKMVDVNGVV